MKTIFEKSKKGTNTYDVPKAASTYDLNESFLRKELPLADVSETEVVRHYFNLSKTNFCVDENMYPLGSCTMKHNPKINEKLGSHPSFALLHPLAGDSVSQGALEIMHDMEAYFSVITGMHGVTFNPAAGSHGELTALMVVKKYFEKKGEERNIVLIPDSAHGTNPASVTMCGFEVRELQSTPEGDVDLDHLKEALDENVACMMLTSPATTGLFDRNIHKIADMVHENGSLFYGDGANLNATLGKARFFDMGFDLMHINVHKTFSTPHGGGGPGSGPISVVEKLTPFLPTPRVEKVNGEYRLTEEKSDSIGRIHGFYGNFLVYLKAWVYIRLLGAEGLKDAGETAVLNANYLLALLKEEYNVPLKRRCMHEFIINDKDFPNTDKGITTDHITKRLLDYGFHAPTVFFPLIVERAMMIEPTETESRETLEQFAAALIAIKKEAQENPGLLLHAPHTKAVKRVDVVAAARKPILKMIQN